MICCSYCILVLFRYYFWWPIWNGTEQHKLAWHIDWPMHIPYIVAMQYFFCSLIVTAAYQWTNFPHYALFLLSIQMLVVVLCTIKSVLIISCLLLVACSKFMNYEWYTIGLALCCTHLFFCYILCFVDSVICLWSCLDAVSLILATLILLIPRSQALLRSKPSLMVGKLPQEDRMGTYGISRSEKMTFFSRNLKGELLLVNSRSTNYTSYTQYSCWNCFQIDVKNAIADC